MALTANVGRDRRRHQVLALSAGATLALVAVIGAWTFTSTEFRKDDSAAAEAAFEEATGVQIVRIAVSAGGGLLDLRYRVLDPDKAAVVHDKAKPPTIIDEATGQGASQPWMPHHRGGDHRFALMYYELIVDPGGIIKRGDRVTVVVGGTPLPHVVVQ